MLAPGRELTAFSADTCETFAFHLKNMAKLKHLVLPLRLPLDELALDPYDYGVFSDPDNEEEEEGEDPGAGDQGQLASSCSARATVFALPAWGVRPELL